MPAGIAKTARKQRDTALEAANDFLAANSDLQASTLATASNKRNRRTKPAHLLGLPGELRNRIYDLALADNGEVTITAADPAQPSLLRACRQIREEGLPIYYTNSRFVLEVVDYDAVGAEQFYQVRKRHFNKGQGDKHASIAIQRTGVSSWENFVAWLEAAHSREMVVPVTGKAGIGGVSQEIVLVYNLCEVATRELSSLPWKKAETILTRMRPSLIKTNAQWVQD